MTDVDGVLAIIRLRQHQPADEILDTLTAAGVSRAEVTLPTPGSLEAISRWSGRDGVQIGAGTVRTAAQARDAVAAGAQFLVTPIVSLSVLEEASRLSVPVVCGAASPTEIELAWTHGAAAVKVFPARALGGPAYVRAVREPLDDVPLIATGGVAVDNVTDYRGAGCIGVGVGSALVSEKIVAERNWADLGAAARVFVQAWSRESR
ncbi:bifunctional 4-hydroxy-2-oxoglutarate aldolase/2-dehydro-3-deoxy-phosphogluconate aldolase [Kocuria aegyptia]|uniref:Bifunctional 4-hydroxy-2-oxoglutarate aldolase/2-dehydro-3-deoxy-phosphogluconate aldolase n=1 Tax=Kocuria aegyptia TaxID=330943 RepID=A0ABP4WYS2_9MICC